MQYILPQHLLLLMLPRPPTTPLLETTSLRAAGDEVTLTVPHPTVDVTLPPDSAKAKPVGIHSLILSPLTLLVEVLTSAKEHRCYNCPLLKRFKTATNLKQHKKIHKGEEDIIRTESFFLKVSSEHVVQVSQKN